MEMHFSLIICTYMRPISLLKLMQSIESQILYPNEIIIVDGSLNNESKQIFGDNKYKNLKYFKVDQNQRGITKQRNFGISVLNNFTDIVCFLDDDTMLEKDYFYEIKNTFSNNKDVIGVGGVSINENRWVKANTNSVYNKINYYYFDGYIYPEGLRNRVRSMLNLQSQLNSGIMPPFSHGRNCGYPPTGKTYEVDLLIGMSMSFRKKVVDQIKFSTYFEGYGLYEDADFSIRALKFGKNVINTNAKLSHFHDVLGRPNYFKYGKMVVRNGWYVWRVKYPNPSFINKIKWYIISILLLNVRILNIFTTSNHKEAFYESLGRIYGLVSLFFLKPK
jgi:GT2 family glycosyltransferase